MPEVSSDLPFDEPIAGGGSVELGTKEPSLITGEDQQPSTLIEFPGVARVVPEWRKQLSQRVREVQERRAREAAEAAALAQESELVSCALPSAQLELVPDREQPVLNPIVSKALERLERARRGDLVGTAAATATALAPIADDSTEPEAHSDGPDKTAARKSKLVVVPPKSETDKPKKPVRLIADGVEDAALSYIDNLTVPPIDPDSHNSYPDRAGFTRRIIAGILDLLLMALLTAPFAAAIEFSGGDWLNPRVIGLMSGIAVALMFSYLTLAIALTGRTPGMRLFSLRTVDRQTGLIPTGGQSIKRALGYIFSLALVGLGPLSALFDTDGFTIYDRFSRTRVIRDRAA